MYLCVFKERLHDPPPAQECAKKKCFIDDRRADNEATKIEAGKVFGTNARQIEK